MALTINESGVNVQLNDILTTGAAGSEEYYIDVDGDGTLNDKVDEKIHLTKADIIDILKKTNSTSGAVNLDIILRSLESRATDVDKGAAELERLRDTIDHMKSQLEDAKAKRGAFADTATPPSSDAIRAEAISTLTSKLNIYEGEAEDILSRYSSATMTSAQKQRFSSLARELGKTAIFEGSGGAGESKFSMASAPQSGPQQGTPMASTDGRQGGGGVRLAYNYGGDGSGGGFGGRFALGEDGGFDMAAYAMSVGVDDSIMNGWDSVNQSATQQKKMMMMFFYFARMAASGDMGAMYRFMQFITYIISKDKALQNINMASKLIELENQSRAALDGLLKMDGSDSTEMMKTMEKTKAEQSSIATSQKLIANMMEEMAQVVEALTGVTKNALESNGRILQRLTRS